MNNREFVKLAVDNWKGRVQGNFSKEDTNETLRMALIEANGGKDTISAQDIIFGRCNECFEIISEIITVIKHDILTSDPFFMQFVDYRNMAKGDRNEFIVKNDEPLVVAEIAEGTQALRRQRLMGHSTYSVPMKTKGIKVFEELGLIMAGRVTFSDLTDKVEKAFRADLINDIYTAWSGAITGLASPYAVTGSYTEANMLSLIEHVKAANGSRDAYIMGTLVALNKVTAAHESTAQVALESKYYTGMCGLFNGVPKIETVNAYKPGTTTFLLSDSVVNVFAGNTKPIMYVTEGNTIVASKDATDNYDLTQEFVMIERTGCAARLNGGEGMFGRYTIS